MAGDWMKIELDLPDKPEVHYIAGALNLDSDAVVGKLIRVWQWFDKHTTDGNAFGVTFALADRISGVTGFGEAMGLAGWLEQKDMTLTMPRFERHTSESAKKRALTAKRAAKHREKSNANSNAGSVINALPREEKRIDKEKDKKESSRFSPPTVEEVGEYCASRGNGIDPKLFVDHYEANAWMRGKTKIRDWRACVRTWEARQDKQPETSYGAGGI